VTHDFDVLQVLRIKGVASEATLAARLGSEPAAVRATLEQLALEGLARQTARPVEGWMLTPAGLEAHGEQAVERRAGASGDVEVGYETFLELNAAVKEVTSEWQDHRSADADAVLEALADLHEQVAEGLAIAAHEIPRFGVYAELLAEALARACGGDRRFIDDPLLPSFHTLWFECHEDFLLTLGRSRAEEPAG
jgi:hypothetical protein